MPPRLILDGERFGRLVVVGVADRTAHGKVRWSCRCDCGTITNVAGSGLKNGKTRSCGCLQRDTVIASNTRHGLAVRGNKADGYSTWMKMNSRCHTKSDKNFHHYGGRGISVCDRWRHDFVAFTSDMGPRPSPGHSIERINNDGNYEPANCRWATQKDQTRNQRRNRLLTLKGETMVLTAWSERLGISVQTIHSRLARGWSEERALTTPA